MPTHNPKMKYIPKTHAVSPGSEFYRNEILNKATMLLNSAEFGSLKTDLDNLRDQVRREVFEQMRNVLKNSYTPSRREFLRDCFTGAMEHDGYGNWMLQVEYEPGSSEKDEHPAQDARALIIETEDSLSNEEVRAITSAKSTANDPDSDTPPWFEVTHGTIERGLGRIRDAIDTPDKGTGNWERELTSTKGLHAGQRDKIIEADLTNEAGNLDVFDYLAILEIALFSEIRYC